MKGMQDQIVALCAGIQTTKEVAEQGWAGTFRQQTIPGKHSRCRTLARRSKW